MATLLFSQPALGVKIDVEEIPLADRCVMSQDSITTSPKEPSDAGASTRIAAVALELSEAFRSLLDALPGRPMRPQALARTLKVDKTVSHRLVTAIRDGDPLATAHRIPGPEPLRRIANAARKHEVPPSITRRAEDAIGAFESLIKDEGGDRSGLDAIISTWLPIAKQRFEREAKQAMYRGARQLRGVAADVQISTHLIHPGSDAMRCDCAAILGFLGLRRIRPEAGLRLGIVHGTSSASGHLTTLTGKAIETADDFLWHEFCSQPEAEAMVRRVHCGNGWLYDMEWRDAVGPSSARDIIMRNLTSNATCRYRMPNDPRSKGGVSELVAAPARTLVFDILIHEDVYPDCQPEVRTVASGPQSWADPNDSSRDCDVLAIEERVEHLGQGVERCWAEEIPAYVQMLQSACDTVGWDAQSFRGYRVRVEYPVFNSELQFVLDLPLASSGVQDKRKDH